MENCDHGLPDVWRRAIRLLFVGALALPVGSCGPSTPPRGHAGRLAATVRELQDYRRCWGDLAAPKVAEALTLAKTDAIDEQPFLYDATLNWEGSKRKSGWLAVFWVKKTGAEERYGWPDLVVEVAADGDARPFQIPGRAGWAVPRGYFWIMQVRFKVVPGEGIQHSLDPETTAVELRIGERELERDMFLSVRDKDGGKSDKLKTRTIQW